MTMMATQEPTDPSVLLNSNTMNADIASGMITTTSNNANSTSSSDHTLLKEATNNDSHPSHSNHRRPSSEVPASTMSPGTGSTGPTSSPVSMTSVNGDHHHHHHSTTTANTTKPSSSSNGSSITATPSSSSAMVMSAATRTPPRSSLANDPNSTPIASIKRPRANLLKSYSTGSGGMMGSTNTSTGTSSSSTNRSSTPQKSHPPAPPPQSLHPMLMSPTTTTKNAATPQKTSNTSLLRYSNVTVVDDSTPLSPMHKIKPVLHRETVAVTNSTGNRNNTHGSDNTASSPRPPDGLMIKDKVDEIFSPVVQFLHDHEHHPHPPPHYNSKSIDSDDDDHLHHHHPPASKVTKSTSDDDISIELDFGGTTTSTSTPHYNTDNDDDDNDNEAYGNVAVDDHNNNNNDDDDDVSMSRPEQHDDTNDGEFNPWQFIASLPPYESVVRYRPPITLPRLVEYGTDGISPSVLVSSLSTSPQSSLRKTLVLDLDETLVHCSVTEPADHIVDFTFPVQFHGETYSVHVKCRPYLQQFLNVVCQHFEVIVFTASQKVYADALLNILDPEGRCIHHRLFRESCLPVEGNYLKDLNVLGRDLSRTVLVDNSPHAFGYQVSNGIPIESWFDCPNDRELIKLQRFLTSQILPADDVRVPVRNKFQSHILIATAPPFP